jgi:hypothetical protein
MTSADVETLLAELEEEYAFARVLPLYQFAWTLAGMAHDRDKPGFDETCREAFDRFVDTHPDLRLVQVPWPVNLSRAEALPADTVIDLDLDPHAPHPVLLQALVHPDELPSGAS